MKKTLCIGMSMTLFISACSPQKEVIREIKAHSPEVKTSAANEVDQSLLELWRNLQVGRYANPIAANLVRASMNDATKAALQSPTLPGNGTFLKEISEAKRIQKIRLLAGTVPYYLDQQILSGTAIYSADHFAFSSDKFVQSLDLAREQALQRRAVETIDHIFEKRSQEIAALIAPQFLEKMSPKEISAIESLTGDLQDKARAIVPKLEKYDRILSNYPMAPNDEVRVLFIGAMATYIAKQVSEHKTVKHIISQIQEASKAARLIQEAYELLYAMQTKSTELGKNLKAMSRAMKDITSEVIAKRDQALKPPDTLTVVSAKRALSDFVYGRMQEGEGDGPFSRPYETPKSIQAFVDTAQSASDNMAGILKTAVTLSTKFGLKVDPGLAKALDTATKVSAAVQIGQTMLAAAATGGVIGALGAFGAAGGLSALGLGGGDPMAADIAKIKEDLDEIKKLQREILEMQVETMKMIQSLAELVTSFHHEQMHTLRTIREQVDIVKEISWISANENLRSCHSMIDFALLEKKIITKNSADYLAVSRSVIYEQINSKAALQKMIKSVSESAFGTCQSTISMAFGPTYSDLNPMVAAMQTGENIHGPFSKKAYSTLVEYWKQLPYSKSAFGMHLPAIDGKTLRNKMHYARSAGHLDNPFEISSLLSTEAIERYVSVLLLIGPITAFDKGNWENLLAGGDLYQRDLAWQRHHGFLQEALRKIQTAIAQESLIAGEPLLPDLASSFSALLSKRSENCDGETWECVIKENTLLRKNLLVYILNQRLGSLFFEDQYRKGLESLDIGFMESILGSEFKGRLAHIKIKDEDGKEKTFLGIDWNFVNRGNSNIQDVLPSFPAIQAGKISYSENLRRLLSLQQKVVEAILEITPPSMSTENEENYLKVMAVK